jgi:Tfp pilus assembly protein PilX
LAANHRPNFFGSDRGVGLVVALMAMLLMTALGLALVLTTSTESKIAGNFTSSAEGLYAADAGIERSLEDLLTVSDWNKVLDGTIQSAFVDGDPSGPRNLPGGMRLDLAEATNVANCGHVATCTSTEMDAVTEERPWGANNPRWKLYAYGPLRDIMPTDSVNSSMYVIVWVGDDPSENDNDPTRDGSTQRNPGSGVITMRSEAYGPMGTHRLIEATLSRTDTSDLERGDIGQDEQNRRARKAARVRILSWRALR